jgi:hypothetical protein
MKLLDAKAAFLAFRQRSQTSVAPSDNPSTTAVRADLVSSALASSETKGLADTLELLCGSFANLPVDDLTPARLREFVSRSYLEAACAGAATHQVRENFPDPQTLLQSLAEFFLWVDEPAADPGFQENPPDSCPHEPLSQPFTRERLNNSFAHKGAGNTLARERLAVLKSLQATLPRAIEITFTLSVYLADRRGAFSFPEFLTSFEEGGQSEYDIGDTAGEVGSIEGYFKILRVDGSLIEAEELITEERVWPILFPQEVARLLDDAYLINLELLRVADHWQIANCGFAYPPDTEI